LRKVESMSPVGELTAVMPNVPGRPAAADNIQNQLGRFFKTSPLGAACAVFLLGVVLVAILANQLMPYDPLTNNMAAVVRPPYADHWLGTDQVGRDVLSRLILGTRISLLVATTAVVVGDSLGFLLGVSTGYLGGRFDLLSQRVIEVLMSFPGLILALLLLVSFGAGAPTVILAIAVTRVPGTTRVIRSVALSVRQEAYVEAARVIGGSTWRIMLRHIAPQCVAPLLVLFSLGLGGAIFTEASLSYLGVGIPLPLPSLGNMLGEQVAQAFRPAWWLVLFPGLAITAIILTANLLGDAVRDMLDPRLKQRPAER
jgi:peptide/nickel transport system permease protein